MGKQENTNDFLAKWANDELSQEEIQEFKKSKEYVLYETILKGTELLDVPETDREKLFERIQEDVSYQKKVQALVPKLMYAAVASIALILGYTLFFNQILTYQSGYGEQLVVKLPDDSEVILNAKTKLYFKKQKWENNERTVFLDGEAFFKVKKGSIFTVQSEKNKVSVLGTQFNVNTNTNFFEVICYEGSVKVENKTLSKILVKGDAIRSIHSNSSFEEWKLNDSIPTWIVGESSFTNTPLRQVISAIEKQYNITILSKNVNLNQRYSGGFTHNDLQNALHTIFDAMDIRFIFTSNNNTIELFEE